MSDPNQPSTPPGWYPDGQGGQRWWDGTKWTEHTRPAEGAAPTQPPAPQVPGADMPTQIAPNRAADYGTPQQPQQPQQPSYGSPATPQQYGAPQQQYGAPGGPGGSQPFGQGHPGGGASGGGKGKLFLLIGAAVGALVLLVVIGLVVFNLVFGGGSPEDVAEEYFDASADGDAEKVCELSSKDGQKRLFEGTDAGSCGEFADATEEQFAGEDSPYDSYEEFAEDLDVSYEIGDVNEKDETATVKYTYSIEYTGDEEGIGELINVEDAEGELEMVKEDGDWKIDSDSGGLGG